MSEADIHIACKKGDMDRVKALVAVGVSVNHKDKKGMTPLYHSVEGNHIDIVRFLSGKGADPNSENDFKKSSPLIAASQRGYTHLAECLLDHKAVVNQGDIYSYTPLYWAARKDQTETAQLLLSRGAHINQADIIGYTPLLRACGGGYYNTAALLLQHGADADICNKDGESPLHGAVSIYCWNNIVQLLLQHKVKIVKNNKGETPLDVARRKIQALDPEDSKNTGKIADYKAIISMLENYPVVQKSEDGSDSEGKVHKKPQGSAAQSDKITYTESTDETYQAENEKGDSCIIDPDIVENVLANVRMKEQEKEVKRLFEGTEAEDYLKDVYKQITNIGKEMKEPETTDDALIDKNLMKLAKDMTSDWRVVGGLLGVKHFDIKQLATEYKSDPRFAAWSMLVSWRDSTERSVRDKIQALKEALLDADRQDIADML